MLFVYIVTKTMMKPGEQIYKTTASDEHCFFNIVAKIVKPI